jgi:hypothetical protein
MRAAGSRVSEASADSAMRTITSIPVSAMSAVRLHYVSLWAWHRRDEARLDSVVQRMRVIVDTTHLATDRVVLDGAEARLALLRGDTATAIQRLRTLRRPPIRAGSPGTCGNQRRASACSCLNCNWRPATVRGVGDRPGF